MPSRTPRSARSRSPDDPTAFGRLLENLVAATLRSLALHAGVRLHHWRERANEIAIAPPEGVLLQTLPEDGFVPVAQLIHDPVHHLWDVGEREVQRPTA